MYKNKKIVPIIIADFDQTGNSSTHSEADTYQLFNSTPESQLFYNLHSLPSEFPSEESFDSYLQENDFYYPSSRGYYSFNRHSSTTPLTYNFFKSNSYYSTSTSSPHLIFNYTDGKNHHPAKKLFGHAFLNHFSYNWETHSQILALGNYLPIVIDSDSEMHKNFYQDYLCFDSRNEQELKIAVPGFNILLSEEVVFVLWRKFKYSYHKTQDSDSGQKVFSNFSFEIFNNLKSSSLNYLPETQTFSPVLSPLMKNRSTLSSNRIFYSQRQTLVSNLQSRFILGEGFDIAFLGDSPAYQMYEALIKGHPNKRLDVIKVPSWKTRSSDKTIEFASYTKSQCLKRRTSLMGILVTFNCLVDSELTNQAEVFNLVSTASSKDLSTSGRALKKLAELLKDLAWKDSVKIWNPLEVVKIYNNLYSGLNILSDACCTKISDSQLNSLMELTLTPDKVFDSQKNQILTAEPLVDLNLKNKFTKISNLYNKSIETLSDPKINSSAYTVKRKYSDYTSLKAQISNLKNDIADEINQISNLIKEVFNSANFIQSNKALHSSIQKKYMSAFSQSLKNDIFLENHFFNNFAKDHIHIVSIKYLDDLNPSGLIITDSSSSDQVQQFIKSKNLNHGFEFQTVEFIIDRPVKIKVDGGNKFIVGGPYKVSCKPGGINICLLQRYSLFGINDTSYAAHPHVRPTNSVSNLFEYTSGCLGEATSLLYNSFKKNDLKLIVLSAMTWVSSANSSDQWGRKASWFPDLADLKEQPASPPETLSVTEEDVESFLSSVCEPTLDEEAEETDFIETLATDTTPPLPQETDTFQEALAQPSSPENTQPTTQTSWNSDDFNNAPRHYTPAFSRNINS
jgi:hypothetical protein